MRREIPAGVAVAVIIVALVVAAGVMWFLMNRPSGGGGKVTTSVGAMEATTTSLGRRRTSRQHRRRRHLLSCPDTCRGYRWSRQQKGLQGLPSLSRLPATANKESNRSTRRLPHCGQRTFPSSTSWHRTKSSKRCPQSWQRKSKTGTLVRHLRFRLLTVLARTLRASVAHSSRNAQLRKQVGLQKDPNSDETQQHQQFAHCWMPPDRKMRSQFCHSHLCHTLKR